MNSKRLAEKIADMLALRAPNADIRSYAEAMVMTYNDGLVLRLKSGDEFQISVVQSAKAPRKRRQKGDIKG